MNRLGAVILVAAVVGLYALLGFVLAPKLVITQAKAFVAKTYGRELQIGSVSLNPFSLQLELRDVVLPDADRRPMVSLKRLFVDFELASIWHRALVFREVTLQGPDLRLVQRPDGSINLADLVPPKAVAAPPRQDSALPRIWIELLSLQAGELDYEDQSRQPQPLQRSFTHLGLELKDFRTSAEGGAFTLSARSANDERLDWKGRLALSPQLGSEGDFSVTGLRLPAAAELAGNALPVQLSAGTLDLTGSYRFKLAQALELTLQLPRVALSGLALRAPGVDADWVQLPALEVSDTVLALPEQSLSIGRVALKGLKLMTWLEPDGSLNLQRLILPAAAPRAAPTRAAPASTPRAAARPWTVNLKQFEVQAAELAFEDRLRAPGQRFDVRPLNLSVSDISPDLGRPLTVALQASVNGQADLKLGGSLTPQPLAAALDVSLTKARLKLLQPFVLPYADLSIRDGTLSIDGKLQATPPGGKAPQFSFAGDIGVDDFKSTDNALGQDLVNFRGLRVSKLRLEQAPDRLTIDSIRLSQPYARVVISKGQVLNITTVLFPMSTSARRAAAKSAAPAAKEAAATRPSLPPRAVAAAQTGPEKFPIRIRELRVDDGRVNFSDLNVQPNFAAEIFGLQGAVTNLSSSPTARAAVKYTGRVDEFSPVLISGSIQPFAFDKFTDVTLQFNNISLPLFNPYSGRFTGYAIAKGKLDTTLHYKVQNRQLDAQHKIRINQLEWGEASASQDAASLPVKLATALLRDRNGVIDLDIPVDGTLDDPKFRIWPIVWKVLGNLIVKVVSAPFTFLGSLFADAQDAQFVDFAPGQADVDAAGQARLAALARGLVEKPGVGLDVPIGGVDELDLPALAERRYLQQRRAAQAQVLGRRADDPAPLPGFETLPVAQRILVLRGLLAQTGPAAALAPAPTPAAAAASGADAEAALLAALEREARLRSVAAPDELTRLGQERGRAVQRALLTGTALEPERVFLTAAGKVGANDGRVRFELGLK